MKDILFVTHFTKAPNEKGNGRFHYIAENINKANAAIEIVTSTFAHKSKVQRYITNEDLESINYKFSMVYEPGYKKNVSLKRFYSHYIFGRNLKRYLEKRKKPDVIYCAVPSLNAAKVAAKYANENNIRFIIDVQDLWPEAFEMVFNIPLINKIFFHPMKKNANYVYESADEIVAVSETYANRAYSKNEKSNSPHTVFLGTDLKVFDQLSFENKVKRREDNEIWLAYIGTLGHSYDLKCVIDALKILKDKGVQNIKFIVMGDGPLKKTFENYATEKEIYTEFTGRLSYGEMIGILSSCDLAVNPISKGAAQSIINKHGDYSAAGLPVLNTQESEEYKKLVENYKIGINCENSNPIDLAKKLNAIIQDENLREIMGENSRKLAEEKFDRSKKYKEIMSVLLK